MDQFKAYYISHKNLDNGWHSFTYKLDDQFFRLFDYEALSDPQFEVVLDMDKSNDSMLLKINVKGQFTAACDRCLVDVPIQIEDVKTQFIRYSEEEREEEDIIFISPLNHRINVAKILYDNVILSLPITNRRDCEEENYQYCDNAILDKIDQLSDIAEDTKEPNEESNVWDALKKLNINN